ncbi:hypothetical protein [Seonamhaeicola sp.]|uniref:hypothetical protein n=1 Tax=Seonamhaeicola sp. TaxID=1912245 RepID=UPI002634742A|nr:hypothetical protein [Seonamhaeicola sp.]
MQDIFGRTDKNNGVKNRVTRRDSLRSEKSIKGLNRRQVLNGLGSLSLLSLAGAGIFASSSWSAFYHEVGKPGIIPNSLERPIRLGLIGFGVRGEQLLRACGYATSEWIKKTQKQAAI